MNSEGASHPTPLGNRIRLAFSRPSKPTDNAHIEAFNSLLRRECLSATLVH